MSKHSTFSSTGLRQISSLGGAACLCLILSGCPSASNPPKESTPPSSQPPPSSSSSSSSGSAGSSSPSTAGQSSPSSPSSGEPSADSDTSSASGSSGESSDNTVGPPEETTDSSGDQTASADGSSGDAAGGSTEAGFGDEPGGSEALPDLRDEPSLEDMPPAVAGFPGTQVGAPGGGNSATDSSSSANTSGGQSPGNSGPAGTGTYGAWPGTPAGAGVGGSGPLTPAEQVAILDAELAKGAGDFDAMILDTEQEQRRAAREQAAQQSSTPTSTNSGSTGEGNRPYEDGGIADAGSYSTGGGIGGTRGGGAPQNTARFPAPEDIPSGSDDDVVARQLREAAMREPDPAVREKLWAEYRKYKGISP